MQASRFLPIFLALLLALPLATAAAEDTAETATVTMPLEEILRLYRETEAAKGRPDEDPPPVGATVHKLDLAGRLLDTAVDFTASFEVVVLAAAEWVSVPLLRHDETTHLSSLPQVPNGFFSVEDGYLRFISRDKGVYTFTISLIQQAERQGRRRGVRLAYEQAALALCKVSFDKGLFRLLNGRSIERSEGVTLFPDGNAFTIEWERREEAATIKKAAGPPVAIESTVRVAHASAVSTLEGRHVLRVRYELRFAGTKSIDIDVPADLTVERAYLNGVSSSVEMEDDRFSLEVSPLREGDQSAVLELVLVRATDGYLLSGSLEVELPRVSWPVNELFLEFHLPPVFNYSWSGGSLSPVEGTPAVHYTYELPLPGKKLSFHQHLISASSPSVTLDYAVDLEGHYYRPQ